MAMYCRPFLWGGAFLLEKLSTFLEGTLINKLHQRKGTDSWGLLFSFELATRLNLRLLLYSYALLLNIVYTLCLHT